MKCKKDLAIILAKLEENAIAGESIANGILAAVKAARAKTLDQFNDMVSFAYQANGWSQRTGRPSAGATERPAPLAVKVYISHVRAGYRLKLDVLSFDTMGALREAIREARTGTSNVRPHVLRGVQVSSASTFTGALLHDVVVLYQQLPDDEQTKLERSLRRLLDRFTPMAPDHLLGAAPQRAENRLH